MAMNPAEPPVPQPPADAHFDEHSGVYGFFRRHQRKLLYTVVLFTLLTFSVGGPMTVAVQELFTTPPAMATLEVGGKRVSMEREDYTYGQAIARSRGALMAVVPSLDAGQGGINDVGDVYAILRRVAIASGLDASFAEVDRAIAAVRERSKLDSNVQVAAQSGFASLAEFRDVMREALRIGQLIQLQTLVLDDSDAAVLQQVIADKEKVSFAAAWFDEKALEAQLKKDGTLTDDDLRKWLDGKSDADKNRIQVYDSNRVALTIGAAVQAKFDPAQWQEEVLKDFQVGDEQMKKTYEQEKDRFKLAEGSNPAGAGGHKPFEDETVKAELTKLLQLDQVQNHLLGKLREKLNEAMQAANEELRKCNEQYVTAQNAVQEAERKVAEAKAKLTEKPEDNERKAAYDQANTELQQAQQVPPAMENAKKAAEEAVKTARAGFDFGAKFAELTKDKAGFEIKSFDDKRNGEQLKDLDQGGLALGQWPLSTYATYLQNKGDLGFQPGRTSVATILYQVRDVDVRPLKAWEQLKPLLEGAYYTEQAKDQAEAKKKVLEASLLELAKAKMPEKVAEIEGKRTESVQKKLGTWESETTAGLQKAEKILADVPPDTQAAMAWSQKRQMLREALDKKADKQKAVEDEVQKQVEADVAEAAKAHHAAVLAAAAEKAGFTFGNLGPYSRDLAQRPRFDKRFDPTVVFLWQNHGKMKVGESTGVVQDLTNRRWLVGACTAVAPLEPSDVERREFAMLRKGIYFKSYAGLRAMQAYQQAWTKDALEARYKYQPPKGEQKVDSPASGK
jgi:hypothetical protein